jgi:2-polyprenyl-3-methyl-5-hydroxy-6-metoxy-1,4-benzoquinol methylase
MASDTVPEDLHSNDSRFVQYYEHESTTAAALARAAGIMRAVVRSRRELGAGVEKLRVADIGCNAGTQSRCWLEQGHSVRGVDISRDLVRLAQQRNASFGEQATFEVGSATSLPWEARLFDVCLMPELLEHVSDWRSCLTEAIRVLKPSGTLYLTTTNVLCPIQQEFTLPLYSWYPRRLKQYVVRRASSDAPQWANYASFPAVHWFNPYRLKSFLAAHGVRGLDRFDLIDVSGRSRGARLLVGGIRRLPPLRFLGHVMTPSTILVGQKAP